MTKRSLGHLGEIDPDNWRNVPDYFLGPFWVGDFCPELKPADYGSNDFHGRFHPAIPWVAMRRFTKPGDTVWDCFAGSGTTLDVGLELGRSVIATDLHPFLSDIQYMDASVDNPGVCSVDLAIMHPPYAGIIDYSCPMSSAKTVSRFRVEFDKCMVNVDIALKPGRILVLVIGEIWLDGELWPLEYRLDGLIHSAYNYRRIGRIVKDFGETKGGKTTTPKDHNLWKYRLLKWGYFRNGIDTILFYQKAVR